MNKANMLTTPEMIRARPTLTFIGYSDDFGEKTGLKRHGSWRIQHTEPQSKCIQMRMTPCWP